MEIFEDNIDLIQEEMEKYRTKWNATVLDYSINFEDICQIIFVYIYQKWHLWNQETPLKDWLTNILQHQFIGHLSSINNKNNAFHV